MKSLYTLFKQTPSPAKNNSISVTKIPNFTFLINSSKSKLHLHQIHAQIILQNLFSNTHLTTHLLSSSFSFNLVPHSLSIFSHSNRKTPSLFKALILGLVNNSCFKEGVLMFIYMLRSGVRLDFVLVNYVANAIGGLGFREMGKGFHGCVLKSGFGLDLVVGVSLVEMYVKVNKLGLALKVFDEMPTRSMMLWNVLINGCCKVGNMKKAVELFECMPQKRISSLNRLINGFLRIGDVEQARVIFDEMMEKDVVTWTTMVDGYLRNGEYEKGMDLVFKMLEEGVKPNEFTVVSFLSICSKVGAHEAGLRMHSYLRENGVQISRAIGNALVNMYTKCWDIECASSVFREMKEKDIVTWTAMIWSWTLHGRFREAIQCFKQMMYAGIKPDEVVFLAILTACSYSGQVSLGLNFFDSMELDYSIKPTLKHYLSIVELLGRSGRLIQALDFIEEMPIKPDVVTWGMLFCASKAHKNHEMAQLALGRLLELEPKYPGSYIYLSNVYASVGRWKDAKRVRALMQSSAVSEDSKFSFIEVGGKVYRFTVDDSTHKDVANILLKLEELMLGARETGFISGTDSVNSNDANETGDDMGNHSEKLALAFGLMHGSPRTTIRIVRNCSICADCHSLMKYVSKFCDREIVLRDVKRYHHFKDGMCSCKDIW